MAAGAQSVGDLVLTPSSPSVEMVAYNRCLQVCFILVQIVFIALGGTLVGLGAWLEVEEQSIQAAIDSRQLDYGPYILIAAGCAIIIVSFLGCAGALCDTKVNRFLLILYIILTLVIFAAQLVGGILAFVYREEVLDVVEGGLNSTIIRYGDNTTAGETITQSWDFIQDTFDCCGVQGVADWSINLLVDGFPESCCANSSSCPTDQPSFAHTDGCRQALSEFVADNLIIIASVGIVFVLGEVVVVLLAFCLICCTDFDD